MKKNINDILLFKTNISTPDGKNALQSTFDHHPQIVQWQIDLEDEDHVLRIISSLLTTNTIIDMVTRNGYHCEELKD